MLTLTMSGVCFLVIISHVRPPRLVSPHLWDVVAVAPSGSQGPDHVILKPIIQGKLDQRFAVSWPIAVRVAVPETVIVRIAANQYEDILSGIDAADRMIKMENFKGEPRLEVTLTADSGFEVVKQHSDVQVVVKNEKHKEWSWTVLPKSTGGHRLILLVQGIHGYLREDYDPEVMEYDVAFNFWYWFSNGIQLNGISWLWAVILVLVTFWLGKRSAKGKTPTPSSTGPRSPKHDS